MIARGILCAGSLALLAACAGTPPRDDARWLPLGGGDRAAFAALESSEIEQLALVSTNLVAALVQLPELSPSTVTLQLSAPRSAFGNTVLRALEDAGYGVQRVAADQGRHYVAYRQRFAETDAGPVTDYELTVNGLRVHREYVHRDTGVYPSSLMTIEGSAAAAGGIVLDDGIFREQGGDEEAFVSGVSGSRPNAGISCAHTTAPRPATSKTSVGHSRHKDVTGAPASRRQTHRPSDGIAVAMAAHRRGVR